MANNGSLKASDWALFALGILFFPIGTTVALLTMDIEEITIIGDILLSILAAGLILKEGKMSWQEIVIVIIAALHIGFSFSYDTMVVCIVIEYLAPFILLALMASKDEKNR